MLGVVGVSVTLLLPWWKNRAYLRDFYDYGLVMSALGRIENGERPYVDFLTPIQSATFLFNGWAERLGGGTYQAMTLGCAVLAVAATVLLHGLLVRVWSPGVALAVAGAVVAGTLVQHTIVWHNGLGVVSLAMVVWAGAAAPLPSRRRWGWALVVGLGLFLGGITKLNVHLVAVAVALGWGLRAVMVGKGTWQAFAGLVGFVVAGGFVLPVSFELAWSGAGFGEWWHNVVGLAGGARAQNLRHLLDVESYLRPIHDYYGTLTLRPVGLAGLVATVAVVGLALRETSRRGHGLDGVLAIFAGVFAVGASMALMATNHEIAYVGLAAWLVCLVGIWIGFDLPRKGLAGVAVTLIAGALGVVFWHSAWLGQRSQFGHSQVARSVYLPAEEAGEAYAYLQGTSLPPEIVRSMHAVAGWRDRLDPADQGRVFHGPGLEWLDRLWPASRPKGVPLWMHIGTTYHEAESKNLSRSLLAGGLYRHVVVPEAYDHWPSEVKLALAGSYSARRMGPVWRVYERASLASVTKRPFEFLEAFQGNVDPRLLASDMELFVASGHRFFLGVTEGRGEVRFTHPSYRLSGEVVVTRMVETDPNAEVKARFELFAENGDELWTLKSFDVVLPPGSPEVVQEFTADGLGRPMRFAVTLDAAEPARFAAGWRAFRLSHAFDGPDEPARLSEEAADVEPLSEQALAALLPGSWRPAKAFTRGGRLTSAGFELPAYGELWLWTPQVTEISGVAAAAEPGRLSSWLSLRAVSYKGGRVDISFQRVASMEEREIGFRTWSAEPGSWLVVVARPDPGAPSLLLKVHEVKVSE